MWLEEGGGFTCRSPAHAELLRLMSIRGTKLRSLPRHAWSYGKDRSIQQWPHSVRPDGCLEAELIAANLTAARHTLLPSFTDTIGASYGAHSVSIYPLGLDAPASPALNRLVYAEHHRLITLSKMSDQE